MSNIVILKSETGNIGSLENMLRKEGYYPVVSNDRDIIASAEKLFLTGVGSFDSGMEFLKRINIIPTLQEVIFTQKTPVLGICLGMQLLTEGSDEGILSGLGFIHCRTKRFNFEEEQKNLKIPHMGWNAVTLKKDSILFDSMDPEPEFYFSHSYHLSMDKPDIIIGTTNYGYDFPSVVEKDNIHAVQFHPEKSHRFGATLIQNFIELS